jgi:hypothetical protein
MANSEDKVEWLIAGVVCEVRELPNGEFEVSRPPSTEKFIYSKEILETVGVKYESSTETDLAS